MFGGSVCALAAGCTIQELQLSNTRFHLTHLLLTAIKATLYVLTLHHLSPSSSTPDPQTMPCRFAASLLGHHSPALIPHSLQLDSSLPPPNPKTEQGSFISKITFIVPSLVNNKFRTSEGYSPPGGMAPMCLAVVFNLRELEEHPDCSIELTLNAGSCPTNARIYVSIRSHTCTCVK